MHGYFINFAIPLLKLKVNSRVGWMQIYVYIGFADMIDFA